MRESFEKRNSEISLGMAARATYGISAMCLEYFAVISSLKHHHHCVALATEQLEIGMIDWIDRSARCGILNLAPCSQQSKASKPLSLTDKNYGKQGKCGGKLWIWNVLTWITSISFVQDGFEVIIFVQISSYCFSVVQIHLWCLKLS